VADGAAATRLAGCAADDDDRPGVRRACCMMPVCVCHVCRTLHATFVRLRSRRQRGGFRGRLACCICTLFVACCTLYCCKLHAARNYVAL
jgi:hypothetical protein